MSEPVVMLDLHRPFVVFGDHDSLSMDPVELADLIQIAKPSDARFQFFDSAVWSSDLNWYFVVAYNGVGMFSVACPHGFFCPKRSAMVFDLFLRTKLP